MYKPGWVKWFAPDEWGALCEEGYDYLVRAHQASWSKGNLKDIIAVELFTSQMRVELRSLASDKYWQCDNYISTFRSGKTRLVSKIVQKQIEERDLGPVYHVANKDFCLISLGLRICPSQKIIHTLTSNELGKWFTIKLDVETNKYWYHLANTRC